MVIKAANIILPYCLYSLFNYIDKQIVLDSYIGAVPNDPLAPLAAQFLEYFLYGSIGAIIYNIFHKNLLSLEKSRPAIAVLLVQIIIFPFNYFFYFFIIQWTIRQSSVKFIQTEIFIFLLFTLSSVIVERLLKFQSNYSSLPLNKILTSSFLKITILFVLSIFIVVIL